MHESQRRAWLALDLGPRWALREPAERDVSNHEFPPVPDVSSDLPGIDEWARLEGVAQSCRQCSLCNTRRSVVWGVGARRARWLIVGEAPGEQEDLSGRPFMGPAGKLLNQMLYSIGVDRDRDAFVTNVIKCRPPRNRDPVPEEIAQCRPYLDQQIRLLEPMLILALGRFAAQVLLRTDQPLGRLRGTVHCLPAASREIPVVVTFHPAYLLRSELEKRKAWEDLRLARRTQDAQSAGTAPAVSRDSAQTSQA